MSLYDIAGVILCFSLLTGKSPRQIRNISISFRTTPLQEFSANSNQKFLEDFANIPHGDESSKTAGEQDENLKKNRYQVGELAFIDG